MYKKIIIHVLNQLKRGYRYRKVGSDISKKSENLMNGLSIGARISYNAISTFHNNIN